MYLFNTSKHSHLTIGVSFNEWKFVKSGRQHLQTIFMIFCINYAVAVSLHVHITFSCEKTHYLLCWFFFKMFCMHIHKYSYMTFDKIINTILEKAKRAPRGVCWKGYKMVGMKKKNGKKVPNCVPSK